MFKQLFHLNPDSTNTLQQQVREQISKAILAGHIPADMQLPSTRELARMLKISRNTVIIAYQELIDDGYLISRQRAGFFAAPDIRKDCLPVPCDHDHHTRHTPDWQGLLIDKPELLAEPGQVRWQQAQYPFVYGQLDPAMFPVKRWRECSLDSVRTQSVKSWSSDHYNSDDPLLIEQIRSRLLPRRGIWAEADEILITVGAQNALYLLLNALLGPGRVFGFENPGYPDLSRIARLVGAKTRALPVDRNGLVVNEQLDHCDVVFTTPSHQFPTTVTMPLDNRKALLERAAADNFLIIEDDYECETNFASHPTPALKSLDRHQRVIYVGSLSKTLSPGLRMGYIVAPKPLIAALRELRRLILRHPPTNNQRTVGLFLERGYHDSLIRHLLEVYEERWQLIRQGVDELMPVSTIPPTFGGSAYWIEGDAGLDSLALQSLAVKQSIIIEPGQCYYDQNGPLNCFRLGYSSIATERIRPGLERLAVLVAQLTR
ncbi:PLP-dependent aminotransferase family protein [Oceanobacter sp. 4_MG-2023]|uniref:MocR-like pyridoxine biosynthesis transcription factor PdxR n=1 Tax=Oceanobacter sp. 4_MG-2023 TaxID=3062623 RepID=UPI0027348574|nr:PLP-dependent aminotransferase family protein [Oceanobacter sp. 4_MG-2023]MDP2548925.1 PLP-dependent aminotransferase family protein [Oceanobacter sp. 4_MG-2023]